MNRQQLPINEIQVIDRQRIDLGDIPDLADSIRKYGLIQPVVVDQNKRLIAGGRRLAAHVHLGLANIDVVFRETMSVDELHELELEENVRRKEMSWQERCLNIAQIHRLKSTRSALEGSKWGMQETAEMLGLRAKSNVHYTLEIAKKLVAEQILSIDQRRYWKCYSMSDAWRLRLGDEADALAKDLAEDEARLSQQSAPVVVKPIESLSLADLLKPSETPPRVTLTSGNLVGYAPVIPPIESRTTCPVCNGEKSGCENCKQTGFAWLPGTGPGQITIAPVYEEYKAEQISLHPRLFNVDCIDFMNDHKEYVDHILTDPPYGIDTANMEQSNTGMVDVDTIAAEHTVAGNELLFQRLFDSAFYCLKPNGFFILWTDQMQWQTQYNLAIQAGFKVQRWPITWVKTHRCMNQMANQNFTKTTEIAMVCRKDTATLIEKAGECHILAPHDEYKEQLGHPFVKPFAVWEYLINHVSFAGQTILEPFAGRGSGVISLIRKRRQFIACEKDSAHFNALTENIKQHYLKINPKYTFM